MMETVLLLYQTTRNFQHMKNCAGHFPNLSTQLNVNTSKPRQSRGKTSHLTNVHRDCGVEPIPRFGQLTVRIKGVSVFG